MKYWRNVDIEARVSSRLAEFGCQTGRKAEPPIPVDLLAEKLFDFTVVYEEMPEPKGLQVLGGLVRRQKKIVVNERYARDPKQGWGRSRFTIAHEIGHWDLSEMTKSDKQCEFDGTATSSRMLCRSASGLIVEVTKRLWHDERLQAELRRAETMKDEPWEKRAVDRYASELLMPKHLVLNAVEGVDLTQWPNLYRLKDLFGVTISALRIRLSSLGRLSVADDGTIFAGSEAERAGQMRIF